MTANKNYKKLSDNFRSFFELPTNLIAISIDRDEVKEQGDPKRYCFMVRECALYGESFVFNSDGISCANGEVALGLTEPMFGEVYPRIIKGVETITIEPLNECEKDPDVVIVLGEPKKVMKVIHTYSVMKGRKPIDATLRGEMGLCGETTAIPYEEGRMNLSLLCNGARMFAGYANNEITAGIPWDIFVEIVNGLKSETITAALCGCIMDDLPKHVIDTFLGMGLNKSTDHLFGKFNGERVRLYTLKSDDGTIDRLALHIPIKLPTEEDAIKAEELAGSYLEKPILFGRRDNWLDVVSVLDLDESINRAVMRGEKFKSLLQDGIETFGETVTKLKRKYKIAAIV